MISSPVGNLSAFFFYKIFFFLFYFKVMISQPIGSKNQELVPVERVY